MANNYGTLEGELEVYGTLDGEIQFGGASGNGVKDVKVNGTSVVDANKVANIDLTPYAEKEDVYDKDAIDTALQAIDTALEGKADTDDIPTELSDLTDDENHRLVTDTEKNTWDNKADESDIPTVNNPTITIQKNNQNIDSFTLNQDSNKSINITVPTKTSDLQNDNSFITNTVNNLANYYLKSDTYTQTEVNNLISAAVNGRFEKVTVLPASGEPNVIYLVPKTTALTNNVYDEYIWQDNAWELLGSTEIDLSNYVTTTDLATALADYVTSSTFNTTIANYYTKTEVGNLLDAKVDKVSGKGLSTYDYDATAKGIVDNVTTNLASKVDKVNGKGLSTEDYTTTEKNKLAGISTGANKVESSTTNGNIQIDGTETQVYDDSDIQDKIDVSLESVSGNPLSISGLKSSQLAVNPVITFEPIQAGSGTPSPSNIRAISGYDKIEVLSVSKNIWGEDWEVGSIDNTTGQNMSDATAIRSKGYIRIASDTRYAFACPNTAIRIYWYGIDKSFISTESVNTATALAPSNAYYLRIRTTGSYGGTYKNDIMVTQGNDASVAYQPSHKTTDLSESLGQTVYGGEYDVRTGKFKVIGQIVDLSTLSWVLYQGSIYQSSDLQTLKKGGRTNLISDRYEAVNVDSVANLGSNQMCGNRTTGVIYVGSTTPTGQLVYELATPFYIQLTPHEIALSQDYAYISTNGKLIALDYHNGELASLSDVETLGQTVENAVGYLEANNRGTAVNLKPYTSAEPYQFPNDGYIIVYGGSATSGRINVALRGNDGGNFGGIIMNVTSATQMQTTFVRKGMKSYLIADTTGATDDVVEYRALV